MGRDDREARRRLALQRYGLLDTAPEKVFDGITLAIANICEVPIALFSLVDTDRQWFKSAYGLTVRETPRDVAFCDHAIRQCGEIMIVEDASADPRFMDNPLVTSDPRIRFYAGKPVVTDDGYALGTLCAIDRKPRRLRSHQLEALNALGTTISAILDERLRLQKAVIDRDNVEAVLHERADRFEHLYGDAESILRGLLDGYSTASVALNRSATIVSANDSWSRLRLSLGFESPAEESYLDDLTLFALPSHQTAVQDGIRQVVSGKLAKFEFSFPCAMGTCSINAVPISTPIAGALVHHRFSKGRQSASRDDYH